VGRAGRPREMVHRGSTGELNNEAINQEGTTSSSKVMSPGGKTAEPDNRWGPQGKAGEEANWEKEENSRNNPLWGGKK